MKKRWVVFPILGTIWPYLLIGSVGILTTLFGTEWAARLLAFLLVCVAIIGVMSIAVSDMYKQLSDYKGLAFWGLMQKTTYVFPLLGLHNANQTEWFDSSSKQENYGMYLLLVGTVVGLAILLIYGLLLLGILFVLIVSACYIVKAINLLYRTRRIENGLRILLVIGSLVPLFDILCGIVVYVISKRCEQMEATSQGGI